MLLLAGETLYTLSSDFEVLNSVSTPLKLHGAPTQMHLQSGLVLNPDYESWQISVGPAQKVIVLAHQDGPQLQVEWLNGEHLQRTGYATMTLDGLKHISAGENHTVLVFVRNECPVVLEPSAKRNLESECHVQWAQMLGSNHVFLADHRKFRIITTSGTPVSKGALIGKITSAYLSSASARLACIDAFQKGSGFPFQTNFAPQLIVRIIDLVSGKQIVEKRFDIPVTSKRGAALFPSTAIALSPSGDDVLLMVGSRLELYRVY